MTTRKEFEKALNDIGWKIFDSGNRLNDWIIAPDGKKIDYKCIGNERIERKRFPNTSYGGGESFYFNNCDLTTGDEGAVNLGSEGAFISFYNFD